MVYVARPHLLSKGTDTMSRPMSFDRVYCPMVMRHATPDIARPCVRSKGNNNMPHPTSSDRVLCQRAIMTCHNRRSLTVCSTQGPCGHATPDVARPCVLLKIYDNVPHLTSSHRVWFPRVLIACHAQCFPSICVVQGR